MGQKTNPISFRLGISGTWSSRWWPCKRAKEQLEEDLVIRTVIRKKVAAAGIVRIDIERIAANTFKVFLKVARPGFVIGRGGQGIAELTKIVERGLREVQRRRGEHSSVSVSITVEELRRSEISAAYVAQLIAWDIERRLYARRVMKRHLGFIMQNREVQGARIRLSGRIGGREISRHETLTDGKLPLQTLRANIDYGTATAFNTYGTIGVKVWIYKGDIFE